MALLSPTWQRTALNTAGPAYSWIEYQYDFTGVVAPYRVSWVINIQSNYEFDELMVRVSTDVDGDALNYLQRPGVSGCGVNTLQQYSNAYGASATAHKPRIRVGFRLSTQGHSNGCTPTDVYAEIVSLEFRRGASGEELLHSAVAADKSVILLPSAPWDTPVEDAVPFLPEDQQWYSWVQNGPEVDGKYTIDGWDNELGRASDADQRWSNPDYVEEEEPTPSARTHYTMHSARGTSRRRGGGVLDR